MTARERAETAGRARDDFLSIVSHELRTPLNSVQTWSHVLEHHLGEPAPPVARSLAGIRTGIEQLVRLIDDMLDASRVVSGRLRVARQPLALRPALEAALEAVASAAKARQVALHARLELGDERVLGDAHRIRQLVWNLLDNAIKFTAPGGNVWVDAGRAGACLSISVRDDGCGIAPERLPGLFDRFARDQPPSSRPHDGLGLGLVIVHHLARLHGGRVTAHSDGPGHGARFDVQLPLCTSLGEVSLPREAGDAHDCCAPLPRLDGLRVLLVDDQRDARESLAALLAHAGADVRTADGGRDAMAQLEAAAEGMLPDVFVCDIAMPDQDGYQTLRSLREWEQRRRGGPGMPAIALSAFTMREDRIRALAAGYRTHLAKPVAPAELIMVVAAIALEGKGCGT
jgi:CheY-like chemotaxis protein